MMAPSRRDRWWSAGADPLVASGNDPGSPILQKCVDTGSF
jgi:hypothetical protein